MAVTLASLKVKLFTDGADKAQIVEMAKQAHIAGFTTNPSLLKKAGVKDYESYARELVAAVPDKHISFEVISDDIEQMIAEARLITKWGKNVYVKLPIINTKGETLASAIKLLSGEGVKINVTVVTTVEQAKQATLALSQGPGGIVSVFAGRLADLGIERGPHFRIVGDPLPREGGPHGREVGRSRTGVVDRHQRFIERLVDKNAGVANAERRIDAERGGDDAHDQECDQDTAANGHAERT